MIDAEDAERVANVAWRASKDSSGYWRVASSTPRTSLHRFVMNAPKGLVVDHVRHDTLDNRKSQLRVVTVQENSLNRRGPAWDNKTSGVRGVHWHKARRKWRVQLWRQRRLHEFGLYETLEEAAAVVRRQLAEWGVPS